MTVDLIKKLRDETGAGVMEIKRALEESGNDLEQAKNWLKKSGALKAQNRFGRNTGEGLVEVYSHNGKLGVMTEVNCETDFVARSEEFRTFVRDLALQIAALKPESVDELLLQEFIKDSSQTVGDLLNALIAKTGEKIVVKRFAIYRLGE